MGNLQVFGVMVHMHVPKLECTKIECKSIKYLFLGYELQRKGYCLCEPSKQKIHFFQDVVFDKYYIDY